MLLKVAHKTDEVVYIYKISSFICIYIYCSVYVIFNSDMDKAKVLEIIEPSSDIDGKLPTSSFDIKKIRTDSLDDADDFPEKEVFYFYGGKNSLLIVQIR